MIDSTILFSIVCFVGAPTLLFMSYLSLWNFKYFISFLYTLGDRRTKFEGLLSNIEFARPFFVSMRDAIGKAFGSPAKLSPVKLSEALLLSILVVGILHLIQGPTVVVTN